MLTEKQLFELIKALQASNFTLTEIIFLCTGVVVAALTMSFLVSVMTEKAKIAATNANYQKLHDQLSSNTSTIKSIEKKITSELWISQQIWQKKYDMYEYIYTQLLHIKKWVDNEAQYVELHMMPGYIAGNYQPYFTEEQEKYFWEEVQQAHDELTKALNDDDRKIKTKELQQKLSNAMTALTEIMITKSILLNSDITIILQKLVKDIGFTPAPMDYEEPDEYGHRIKTVIETVLQKIRTTAISDLELNHHNV